MRIGVFSHSLSRTGAPRIAIDVAEYLASRGDTTFLLYPTHRVTPAEPNRLQEIPESVQTLCIGGLDNYWRTSLRDPLRRRLGRGWTARCSAFQGAVGGLSLDGIVFNTCFHADLQRAATSLNIRSARYLHEGASYLGRLSRAEVQAMSAGPIFACSDSVATAAKSKGLVVDKHRVPGCTDSLMEVTAATNRRGHRGPLKEVFALGVGTSFRKGFHWAKRLAGVSEHKICWIGDQSLSQPNLEVIPMQEIVPYDQASVFLLLSEEEPWGIVAMEAVAHGVPLVGWRTLDVIKAAEATGVGRGVEYGDLDGLVSAMHECWGSHQSPRAAQDFLGRYRSGTVLEPLAATVRRHFGGPE